MGSEHRDTEMGAESVDVAAMQAELLEAKRIGTWLYERAPAGLRRHLGDTSEWPWLLDGLVGADTTVPVDAQRADAAREAAVLRAFAELQSEGENLYFAAEYVARLLRLSTDEFDAALSNLVARGLVEGGKTFTRSFVERVTAVGMVEAGAPVDGAADDHPT